MKDKIMSKFMKRFRKIQTPAIVKCIANAKYHKFVTHYLLSSNIQTYTESSGLWTNVIRGDLHRKVNVIGSYQVYKYWAKWDDEEKD